MRMLLIVAAMLPLAACQSNWEKEGRAVESSGTGATRSFAATGFTGVALMGPDDVDVKHGAQFSVVAEGDPKVLDRLEIQVVDGVLRVKRKKHEGGWHWDNDNGAKIHVVMPKLTAAKLAGSGNMAVDKAEGAFDASVAGSGNMNIADMRASDASLSIAGSGDINVAGSAQRLNMSIAGSGGIDAAALAASGADISIAGSGDIKAKVSGQASVSIVGSGDVELSGGAKCTVNRVGSGEARCS